MMELQILSTGSKGNCYVLKAGGQTLLLDAGVSIKKIIAAVDMRSVVGCVVTHEHQDHCKAAKDLERLGIPLIASKGTLEHVSGLDGRLMEFNGLAERETKRFGDFLVLGFKVQHDAVEPYGFIVKYIPTGESFLYATDTYYLRYTFPKVNYWMIECNYVQKLIEEDSYAAYLRNRLITSHMSLERLLDVLAANDLSHTRKIVLVHLSDSRSDEDLMIKTITEQTGIETVAAADGMIVDLQLAPF